MIHFAGTVTCPSCDIPLTLVAASREMVTERSVILRCPRCRVEQQLLMRMIPVLHQLNGRAPNAAHGTASGYRRHTREDTPICEPCRRAHALDHQERKERARNPVTHDWDHGSMTKTVSA